MNILRRLVCAVVGHATAPGVVRAWSWRYHCLRCGRLVPGSLSGARR
jgi:hypothetical protein